MLSVDTNILAYAYNSEAAEHIPAARFIQANLENEDFAISEYVLVEFYNVVRNSSVMSSPLSAAAAVKKVQEMRSNPNWTLLRTTHDVSEEVWRIAATPQFPRRAIFDARLAYSLKAEGVKRFATRNVADFERFGLFEVFDPVLG